MRMNLLTINGIFYYKESCLDRPSIIPLQKKRKDLYPVLSSIFNYAFSTIDGWIKKWVMINPAA